MKISINGFGRIGRCILRSYIDNPRNNIIIDTINSTSSIEESIHLLKYDSIFGRLNSEIKILENNYISINDYKIKFISEKNPENINWSNIDLVMECTGAFTSYEDCMKHIKSGAKKVMLSAPSKDIKTPTLVYGVNNHILTNDVNIFSIGSCTTNCLAPIAKIIDDHFTIESGFMTTIHSYTGDQNIVDGRHKDPRRARAGAVSMVPTSTGAAKALSLVLPNLAGKLDGAAIRVPTPNVSVVDLVVNVEKNITVDAINNHFINYANTSMKNVLGCEIDPLVSCDFIKSPFSSNVDLLETKVVGNKCLRVLSWYDNEWAFANRMLDITSNLL